MAFMDQTKKAKIAAALKKVVPSSWKYTLRVHHHSTIIFTVSAAPVDLFNLHANREQWTDGYIQLNEYYLERQYTGEVLAIMLKIREALNIDNFDHSDVQTDYFCVGHYANMHIGRWDKPFVCTAPAAPVPPATPAAVEPAAVEPTRDELKAKIAELEKQLGIAPRVYSACYCSSLSSGKCDFCTGLRKLVKNFDQGVWFAYVLCPFTATYYGWRAVDKDSALPVAERTMIGGPIVFEGKQYGAAGSSGSIQ
jgi:hypothetical protein